MSESPSSTAFGKYSLIAELGHGGMADVFLAVQQGPVGFNKLVVIKRLRETFADDPEFVSMLLDEARLAARLNHPNVVQTNEVDQVGRHHFIAMEYLDGQPLHRIAHRSAKKGGIPLVLQVRILADVLAGLHHAHELTEFDGSHLGVVHRDVTPHNIFLTYAGQVKVVDFGIAKAVGRSAETRTGVVKGKVTYMAPEQAVGGAIDRRADLFSVGIMLWEAVTGQRMWQNVQDLIVVSRLVNGEINGSPKSVNPAAPDALDAICRKALAIKPEDRYATAADFQTALEDFIRSTGEPAGPRDLSEFVSSLFKDRRDEMKAIIDRQLAELKAKPASPISLAQLDPMSASNLTLRSLSVNIETPAAEVLGPPKTAGDPIYAERPARKRSPAQLGLGAFLLVLAGVGAYAGLSPSPSPSTATEGQEVRLQLRALPASAKITLDGRQLENPYVGAVAKDGKKHALLVEAEGYGSERREVVFDADIVLDLTLEKETPEEPRVAASADVEEPPPAESGKAVAGRPPRGGRRPPPAATETPSSLPQPQPPPSGKPKRKLDEGEMW